MRIIPRLIITTIAIHLLYSFPVSAQNKGEKIFKETCVACHTIGRGKLVGPDLANVQDQRPEEWLIRFIRSSQTVIKSGDKYADSLFKAYNQMPMPDHPNLSDAQIKDVLAYIETQSAAPQTSTASAKLPPGNSSRGRELFVGNIRFTNNGASCNSCHNVALKGYISGGALGKDLTHAVTRLSAEGVSTIISGLPFPQMKETYASRPVTPQEIADITAFLSATDKQAPVNTAGIAGAYLLFGGAGGIVILAILYSVFWKNRKRGPVYFRVFNRQLRSA